MRYYPLPFVFVGFGLLCIQPGVRSHSTEGAILGLLLSAALTLAIGAHARTWTRPLRAGGLWMVGSSLAFFSGRSLMVEAMRSYLRRRSYGLGFDGWVRSMEDAKAISRMASYLNTWLLVFFGATALYLVIAAAMKRRTPEHPPACSLCEEPLDPRPATVCSACGEIQA